MKRWLYVCFLFYVVLSVADAQVRTESSGDSVLKVELEFQNSHMSSSKLIDPLSPPRDVRVGVVEDDTVKFKAKLTPSVTLQNSDYVWTGVQNGNGPEIDITFNSVGTHSEQLQVLNCSERTGLTTVVDVPWVTEEMWGLAHANRVFISPTVYELRDESLGWAAANWSLLGGTPQVRNCRADAGRHAYWNAIMTAEWNFNDAEGIATAHERNNLNNNDPHNESVMDLENNADGRNIGTSCGTNRNAIQSAVLDALNAGSLTILDDYQNINEVGLLKPSNQ